MRTTTYGVFVLLVCQKNYDAPPCTSIKKLIETTDIACQMLGCEQKFTYLTKYAVIKGLVKDGLLTEDRKGNCIQISLSEELKEFIKRVGE